MTLSTKCSNSKRKRFLVLALLATILLSPWLHDHGMLPSIPRTPESMLIGCTDYIANPIWQLHSVYGWGSWFRSYYFTCEFNTSEKVILRDPNSWTKGNGANIDDLLRDANDFLPADLIQAIKNPDSDYWFRDTYPHETTVLFRKRGSDHYSIFSAGAG